MVDSTKRAIYPEPVQPAGLLEVALHNLSLGLTIFDDKRAILFCNKRYMEIYGLSPEQVTPGTPLRELIQHRLNLGLKISVPPEDYIREHVGNALDRGRIDAFLEHFVQGGQLTQLKNYINDLRRHVVDFLFRVETAQAEPDRRYGTSSSLRRESSRGAPSQAYARLRHRERAA